jgi:hypothetical protein
MLELLVPVGLSLVVVEVVVVVVPATGPGVTTVPAAVTGWHPPGGAKLPKTVDVSIGSAKK